jgi:exocyst complex component 2
MVENSKRPLHRADWAEENLDLASPVTHISATRLTSQTIDYTCKEVRLLLTLSNLQYLRSKIIPELLSQFETAFSVKLTDESKTITDALRQIDKQLFEEYTRPIVAKLRETVNKGIISPTWGSGEKPTDAEPYIYTSLLLLVTVHAQVSTSAPSLTSQIIGHLALQLSIELRDTLAKIPKFNLGKLLQATLDTEFMAQTLGGYCGRECNDIQSAIYVGLDGKSDAAARQGLQAELGGLKNVLGELKGRSRSEFRCFRKKSASQQSSS